MRRLLFAIAVLGLLLIACDADAPPSTPINGHPATLAGTSWTIAAIGGVATPRDPSPTIGFDATTVKGSGGCNGIGGRYAYDPASGELRFDQVGMTLIGCDALRSQAENALLQALGQPFLVATLAPDGHVVLAGAGGPRLDLVAIGPAVTD